MAAETSLTAAVQHSGTAFEFAAAMKAIQLTLCVLFLAAMHSRAQEAVTVPDTAILWRIPETEVKSTQLWDNDTARYRYNQLKHYVQTVLPYVNAATATVTEVNNKLSGGIRGAERRRYLAGKDRALRTEFEDRVKSLNTTQGVLLIKLIGRQTGANLYDIISETKGGLTAVKWQAWARWHGINLARPYDPAAEPQLERIMRSLGYELPTFYAQAE